MGVVIQFPGLDPLVRLVGDANAEIPETGYGYRIPDGNFHLVIGNWTPSTANEYKPRLEGPGKHPVQIKLQNGKFVLTSCVNEFFTFKQPVFVGSEEEKAWLRWSWVLIRNGASSSIDVFLQDAILSLGVSRNAARPTGITTPWIYFRANQDTSKRKPWTKLLGFGDGPRLRKSDRGFEAVHGGPGGGAEMDEPGVASLKIPEKVEISFWLCKADLTEPSQDEPIVRMSAISSPSNKGVRFQVQSQSGLQLPEASEAGTQLTFDRLEVRSSWIHSVSYRSPVPQTETDLVLQKLPKPAGQPGTRLWTTSKRTSFWFGLNTSLPNSVQLVHLDSSVLVPAQTPSLQDSYRGLWIHGLGSSRSPHSRLDASVATITLNNVSKQFEFRSGGPIIVAPSKLPDTYSYLVPKPNPDDPGRRIDIPLADAFLGCDWQAGSSSPFQIDTQAKTFIAPGVRLMSPCFGSLSSEKNADAFDYFQLAPATPPVFRTTDDGLFPIAGEEWADNFDSRIDQELRMLEHPGGLVTFRPGSKLFCTRLGDKETLAYKSLDLSLSYDRSEPPPMDAGDLAVNNKDIKVQEAALDVPWVKRNQVNDLVMVLSENPKIPEQIARIQQFVDNNTSGTCNRVLWPLGAGMISMLLRRTDEGVRIYAPAIARALGRNNTSLGFDFSSTLPTNSDTTTSTIQPRDIGSAKRNWREFAEDELPVPLSILWPRARLENSSRLDPSDPLWSGIFFRDMPLVFNWAGQDLEKWSFLKNLLQGIEKNFYLHYGWMDETGATWWAQSDFDGSITPDGWGNVLTMTAGGFKTQGANGRIVVASVNLHVDIKAIATVETGTLNFGGEAHFDLLDGIKVDNLDIAPSAPDNTFTTDSIPGFKKIIVDRFSTNLRQVGLKLLLTPGPQLATIFPFLKEDIEIPAACEINLQGSTGGLELGLILPTDQPTNLFGRFAATVQGAKVVFDQNAHATLTFFCRLNFGLGGFKSVGARVSITKDSVNSPTVTVDPVTGSLDLAGFDASLTKIDWTPATILDPIISDKADDSALGLTYEFTGLLDLQSAHNLLHDVPKLSFRIGTTGELTYWIAVSEKASMKFGALSLEDLIVVLVRHADYVGPNPDHPLNRDNLSRVLAGLSTDPIRDLRTGQPLAEFLNSWQPSGRVGTFVAASGFLGGLSPIISSLKDRTLTVEENKGDATALAFSDGGLMRVDAACKIMEKITVRFSVAIDWAHRYFRASFGMPQPLNFPYDGDPDVTVQAGQIALGICFQKRAFEVGLGWPEHLGGDALERDWSKSLLVHYAAFFPINTLWGGFRAAFDPTEKRIVLGWAARVGWTRQYEWGENFIGVRAELSVSIGGVMEFIFDENSSKPTFYTKQDPEFALLRETRLPENLESRSIDPETILLIRALDNIVTTNLELADESEPVFGSEWYADISGSATAQLFGVTVAGVWIHAKVRMKIVAKGKKLCKISARASFTFIVNIGCIQKSASASLEVVVLDNHCAKTREFADSSNYLLPAS